MMNFDVDISSMSKEHKDMFMQNVISKLSKLKAIKGTEGIAYFLDDKYILKEYTKDPRNAYFLNLYFNEYCEEILRFSQSGYSVPQIYDWLSVEPKKSIFAFKNKPAKFYILEEQIKGRSLFVSKLRKSYYLFQNVCSYEEFENAIIFPEQNMSLYLEILRGYIGDYIFANTYIESMPDARLDEFITSIAKMFEEGKCSIPDVHSKNVLISKSGLKLIDNFMLVKESDPYFSTQRVEEFLLARLSILFKPNEDIKSYLKTKNIISSGRFSEIESLVGEHAEICYAALEKVFKSMKRCLNGRTVENNRVLHTAYQRLSHILDFDKATDLIKVVNERYF